LTYSVHAASTVLACAQRLWSRRNLLDEIDASTLQLLRSCVRFRGRPPSARCPGPPVGTKPSGRRLLTFPSRRQRLSADRCAPRSSRAMVRRHGQKTNFNVGLSQRSRGRPGGSPRESRVTIAPAPRAVKATRSLSRRGNPR